MGYELLGASQEVSTKSHGIKVADDLRRGYREAQVMPLGPTVGGQTLTVMEVYLGTLMELPGTDPMDRQVAIPGTRIPGAGIEVHREIHVVRMGLQPDRRMGTAILMVVILETRTSGAGIEAHQETPVVLTDLQALRTEMDQDLSDPSSREWTRDMCPQ